MKRYFVILLLFAGLGLSSQQRELERPKVGLVLSGGGARGIAHVGVLKVLQEAGLEFDLITGTSMGSVVGGLYAIGYSAVEMEKILEELDWDEILFDRISRSSISLEEKEDFEKYIGSFPIKNKKISLPTGLVAGQQVYALLTRLCLSVHHIEDFDQLPIPFRCLGTDIEFGKVVVLKEGFLPDAIRASLSIPSVFSPIEIEGQLLVDGGILRNFPVVDCLEMGADIIVGVDVGIPLYSKKELNSLVKIFNQAIAFQGVESTLEARRKCDLLIIPAVDDYTIMDFGKVQELIALGEQAATEMLPQITALIDSLKDYPSRTRPIPLTQIEKLFIHKVYIQGLRNVSHNLVDGKLQIKEDAWITTDKLQTAIERVYGSQYFEQVTYKLVPQGSGVDLFVRVVEKSQDDFNFAVHIERTNEMSILLNTTFRNKFVMGSKLSLNLILGDNPRQEIAYFIHTGWKPGFGFGAGFKAQDQEIKIFENGLKIALCDCSFFTGYLDLQTIVSNSSSLGGRFEYSETTLDPDIAPPEWENKKNDYNNLSYKFYGIVDTYDRSFFPRRGVQLYAYFKRSYQIFNSLGTKYDPINVAFFKCSLVDKLAENLVHEEMITLGNIKGRQMPIENNFYLGGTSSRLEQALPFIGYDFMSTTSRSVILLAATLRYEFLTDFFLSMQGNWALLGNSMTELISEKEAIEGYGISLGVITPLGPVELTATKNGMNDDYSYTLEMGYDF